LDATLKRARSGDTIVLDAGDYLPVNIVDRSFEKPLVIDSSRARIAGIVLRRSIGIEWRGGKIAAQKTAYFGILMDRVSRVRIIGMTVSGAITGISIGHSTDVDVVENRLDGLRSDGINLGVVQRINVLRNQCMNFQPVLQIYDAVGKMVKDGDHPDCIQGWSRKGSPPTSDINIIGNKAVGVMQGISFFDMGQGGYDRLTIKDNDLTLGAWHGIAVFEGRNTVITGNTVRTLPGAKTRNGRIQDVKTWVKTVGGSGERVCGNSVAALPHGEGTGRCSKSLR
jgi:nitrous oxidase accessory protein NosD